MNAKGTYKPTTWEEKSYQDISPGMKMTKASVVFAFSGQIEGEAAVEYLMFYRSFDEKDPHKSDADYVGLIRLNGKVNGKAGSFVMEDKGIFKQGEAKSALAIIPGSGTGDLKGITGSGKYNATAKGAECELNYELK